MKAIAAERGPLLHVPPEEGENLFRIFSEVVVAVLKVTGRLLNPDHLFVLASKHVEGFLRVFRVLGPCVVSHLNRQVRHRDCRGKELRRQYLPDTPRLSAAALSWRAETVLGRVVTDGRGDS